MERQSVSWGKNIHTPEFLDAHREWRFRKSTLKKLRRKIFLPSGSSIIEIGCGTGVLCRCIKFLFPEVHVTGFDNEQLFIDYANSKKRGCEFLLGDARNFNTQQKFDCVLSHTIMEYMDEKIFFNCAKRLLIDEGRLIVISSTPYGKLNPVAWSPEIKEVEELIKNHGKSVDLSSFIQVQGYKEQGIMEIFERNGFVISEISYIMNASVPFMMSLNELSQYKNVLKQYQMNRIETSVSLSDIVEEREKLRKIIGSYFDDLFQQEGVKYISDIEVLRIITARKKASEHSYC